MPPTIRGVYREGKIELAETPPDVCAGTFVVVIFFHPILRICRIAALMKRRRPKSGRASPLLPKTGTDPR